jgi:hypothetical protein
VVDVAVTTVGGQGVAQPGWRHRAVLLLEAGEELQEGGKLSGGGEWIRGRGLLLAGARMCAASREIEGGRERSVRRRGRECAGDLDEWLLGFQLLYIVETPKHARMGLKLDTDFRLN